MHGPLSWCSTAQLALMVFLMGVVCGITGLGCFRKYLDPLEVEKDPEDDTYQIILGIGLIVVGFALMGERRMLAFEMSLHPIAACLAFVLYVQAGKLIASRLVCKDLRHVRIGRKLMYLLLFWVPMAVGWWWCLRMLNADLKMMEP